MALERREVLVAFLVALSSWEDSLLWRPTPAIIALPTEAKLRVWRRDELLVAGLRALGLSLDLVSSDDMAYICQEFRTVTVVEGRPCTYRQTNFPNWVPPRSNVCPLFVHARFHNFCMTFLPHKTAYAFAREVQEYIHRSSVYRTVPHTLCDHPPIRHIADLGPQEDVWNQKVTRLQQRRRQQCRDHKDGKQQVL